MIKIYGIKNCDTMKKARLFLTEHQLAHQFVDYRVDGLDAALINHFCQQLDWQLLLNTRGTTFRALPEDAKANLDQEKAIALMLAQPAIIKRPVLDIDGQLHLGFSQDQYQQLFKSPV
ncbi:ArsC family reductase [Rheinheimera riviphila]|uniref:ArsC family reductase n=1 Tax=Rheinheimera riviphila TaxID=1834037 RepID=A0A437R309_9GAMM|nr:ArsC family reductase [Rheinheimera riviphila]RVU41169.1 ArsC family reductase [Rheinheimera riviphila]